MLQSWQRPRVVNMGLLHMTSLCHRRCSSHNSYKNIVTCQVPSQSSYCKHCPTESWLVYGGNSKCPFISKSVCFQTFCDCIVAAIGAAASKTVYLQLHALGLKHALFLLVKFNTTMIRFATSIPHKSSSLGNCQRHQLPYSTPASYNCLMA